MPFIRNQKIAILITYDILIVGGGPGMFRTVGLRRTAWLAAKSRRARTAAVGGRWKTKPVNMSTGGTTLLERTRPPDSNEKTYRVGLFFARAPCFLYRSPCRCGFYFRSLIDFLKNTLLDKKTSLFSLGIIPRCKSFWMSGKSHSQNGFFHGLGTFHHAVPEIHISFVG